jgi:hypothetical protein
VRIVDPDMLDLFRLMRCEYCKRPCRYPTHPHHVFGRGFGGGTRLDIRVNLIGLCGPWDGNCHGLVHAGKVLRCNLLAVIAAREGCLQGDIEAEVYRLRRLAKRTRA